MKLKHMKDIMFIQKRINALLCFWLEIRTQGMELILTERMVMNTHWKKYFQHFLMHKFILVINFYKMAVSMEHLKTRAYNAKNMSEEDRTKVRNMT